jgi:putative endonuclease
MKQPCVYIMADHPGGTLYTGVTSNLLERVLQHKNKTFGGFSAKYNCKMLVFYEIFQNMTEAITAEKKLKSGSRLSKIKHIQSMNPDWKDLSSDWKE